MRRKRNLFSKKDHLDESLINLTPLLDVVFVVLIAFIIIAPLLEVDHISLAKASVLSEKDLSNKSPIVIYVREDNSIWINDKLCMEEKMLYTLKNLKEEKSDTIPQLYHDEKAFFGTYQKVKDSCERAGFKKIDVILKGK